MSLDVYLTSPRQVKCQHCGKESDYDTEIGITTAYQLIQPLRDGLSLMIADQPMNWQPIETAPKDGTPILVWTHRRSHEIAKWNPDRFAKMPKPYWETSGPWGVHDKRQNPPLAWMPLPDPPGTVRKSIMHCQQCGEIRGHDHQCTETKTK